MNRQYPHTHSLPQHGTYVQSRIRPAALVSYLNITINGYTEVGYKVTFTDDALERVVLIDLQWFFQALCHTTVFGFQIEFVKGQKPFLTPKT